MSSLMSTPPPSLLRTTTITQGAWSCSTAINGDIVYCEGGTSYDTAVPVTTQSAALPTPSQPFTATLTLNGDAQASAQGSSGPDLPMTASSTTTSPATTLVSSPPASQSTSTSTALGKAPPHNSSHPASGVIAGAVVGSLIGLAAVVGLILFLLHRRKAHHFAKDELPEAIYARLYPPKPAKLRKVPAHFGALLDSLPAPASEDEIKERISKVLSQIGRYIADYYHDAEVEMSTEVDKQIAPFETAQLSESLPYSFAITKKPTLLIQHCLLFHVINLTLSPGPGTRPFLSNTIAHGITDLHHKACSGLWAEDVFTAFGLWKQLTSYLGKENVPDSESPEDQSEKLHGFANQFVKAFTPWSKSDTQSEKSRKCLEDILQTAIEAAVWLFSQPDIYAFDWGSSAEATAKDQVKREVVFFPGVRKVVPTKEQASAPSLWLFHLVRNDL